MHENLSESMSDVIVTGALSGVIALLVVIQLLSFAAFIIAWRRQKKQYQQKLQQYRPDLKSRRWTNKKHSITNTSEEPFSMEEPNKLPSVVSKSLSAPALPTHATEGTPPVPTGGNEYIQSLPRGNDYAAIDVTQTDYVPVYTRLNV